jgi:O-antigen ligase
MKKTSHSKIIRTNQFLRAPVFSLILWACLWLNLNTGFWNFKHPNGMADWLLLIRAALPFAVLSVAGFVFLSGRKFHLPKSSPSRLLLWYGLVAVIGTIFSPKPMASLYWSVAFLATILAAWTFVDARDPISSTRQLLLVTWIGTFIIAAIIAHQAGEVIFGVKSSAYGSITTVTEGLSRSSGVARWAAVPGLVCLVRAYHTRRPILIAMFLGVATIAFFIVYKMQSRGAVFGVVTALLFALLISSRMRRYALPFTILAVVLILLVNSPATVSNHITKYLERGQSEEEFVSMTGRTRAYNHGITAFINSPLFGYGQWADREIIHEHVHNSYLSALMNAGIVGGIPYLGSWITGWILFFKLQKKSAQLRTEDRICLLEAGTVMMFFTVRAIPETTTAEFGVDLLVMAAVYVYMEILAAATAFKQAERLTPIRVYAKRQHLSMR